MFPEKPLQPRLLYLWNNLSKWRWNNYFHRQANIERISCQKLPTSIVSKKKQGNMKKRKESTSASLTILKPSTVWITTNWKILKEMQIPDHLTCLQRSLYARQETTVITRHGTTDWFKIRKGAYIVTLLS